MPHPKNANAATSHTRGNDCEEYGSAELQNMGQCCSEVRALLGGLEKHDIYGAHAAHVGSTRATGSKELAVSSALLRDKRK
jgi:hypothetical protein